MAPGTSTDFTPLRLSTTPDWLSALFFQVSSTDVVPTAFAARFDGAAGTAESLADEAALAVDTAHKAAITVSVTASSRLLGLAISLFIVPHPSVLSRYLAGPDTRKNGTGYPGWHTGTGATNPPLSRVGQYSPMGNP